MKFSQSSHFLSCNQKNQVIENVFISNISSLFQLTKSSYSFFQVISCSLIIKPGVALQMVQMEKFSFHYTLLIWIWKIFHLLMVHRDQGKKTVQMFGNLRITLVFLDVSYFLSNEELYFNELQVRQSFVQNTR